MVPVDIGGRLTKTINEVAVEKNLDTDQTKILRFANQTFVLVNQAGKWFDYSPYQDFAEAELKSRQIISESDLRN